MFANFLQNPLRVARFLLSAATLALVWRFAVLLLVGRSASHHVQLLEEQQRFLQTIERLPSDSHVAHSDDDWKGRNREEQSGGGLRETFDLLLGTTVDLIEAAKMSFTWDTDLVREAELRYGLAVEAGIAHRSESIKSSPLKKEGTVPSALEGLAGRRRKLLSSWAEAEAENSKQQEAASEKRMFPLTSVDALRRRHIGFLERFEELKPLEQLLARGLPPESIRMFAGPSGEAWAQRTRAAVDTVKANTRMIEKKLSLAQLDEAYGEIMRMWPHLFDIKNGNSPIYLPVFVGGPDDVSGDDSEMEVLYHPSHYGSGPERWRQHIANLSLKRAHVHH